MLKNTASPADRQHSEEVLAGERFEFGANWARFLRLLNEDRISLAQQSLCKMLGVSSLKGRRFLDAGSGSGLFSLAARRLGATVHSFDYDPKSVACTAELRKRFFPADDNWVVEGASVLDRDYLARLGQFDVVYSWGVLHHTGAMWEALSNVAPLVTNDGRLYIAIYNSQGWVSHYWTLVKKFYTGGVISRWAVLLVHLPYLFGLRFLLRAMTGRLNLERGMSLWHDMIDWIGGYPFEVARPEEIFRFYRDRGFSLDELKTCGGRHGCNEFVFSKAGRGKPQF
ncbi:MAG: class I SAM-dependent methyltransferase [Sulfuritalea sp.]|nr:class I SAM-dependent methyltransferase [Sulfuritalea sp.]